MIAAALAGLVISALIGAFVGAFVGALLFSAAALRALGRAYVGR